MCVKKNRIEVLELTLTLTYTQRRTNCGAWMNVPIHLQTIINLTGDNSKRKTQISDQIGKLGGTILKRTFLLLYRINWRNKTTTKIQLHFSSNKGTTIFHQNQTSQLRIYEEGNRTTFLTYPFEIADLKTNSIYIYLYQKQLDPTKEKRKKRKWKENFSNISRDLGFRKIGTIKALKIKIRFSFTDFLPYDAHQCIQCNCYY